MQIQIKERLRPFSQIPGSLIVLPGTELGVRIYPALIQIFDFTKNGQMIAEEKVPVIGPLKVFTVQLDVESFIIKVWGEDQVGFFRYSLRNKEVMIEKGLKDWSTKVFSKVERFEQAIKPVSRLSLGNHKKQDWDLVLRRGDLTEILPTIHRLGQFIDCKDVLSKEGTAALIIEGQNVSKDEQYEALKTFCKIAFHGILAPTLTDISHQGLTLPKVLHEQNPLVLLHNSAKWIESLFVSSIDNNLSILPKLPKEFHAGRLMNVSFRNYALIDIEWSKKSLKRLIIRSLDNQSFKLNLSKDIKSYRLNGVVQDKVDVLEIQKGETYFFDRFSSNSK